MPPLRESVDDLSFPRAAADCVAIWNTFDQLPDPHPALQSARRCLRSDGILVVRVPSGRCFESCMRQIQSLPRPLASVLLAAMAWNNLLSFPYLHGYSIATLDRLVAGYGFERIHAQGDVLTRLADAQTTRWGAWEERALKAPWKLWFRARGLFSAGGEDHAPWIDVYYRVRETR